MSTVIDVEPSDTSLQTIDGGLDQELPQATTEDTQESVQGAEETGVQDQGLLHLESLATAKLLNEDISILEVRQAIFLQLIITYSFRRICRVIYMLRSRSNGLAKPEDLSETSSVVPRQYYR